MPSFTTLITLVALLMQAPTAAEAQRCDIDGPYAPVCPGSQSANGCCWRNGESETIDSFSAANVVDEGADADDEGEEILTIVCELDQAGCEMADSGDWGDDYETGTSNAKDTVRFFASLKDLSGKIVDAETEIDGTDAEKADRRKNFVADFAKDIALAYVCDQAKVQCEDESGGGDLWIALICLGALGLVVFACVKSKDDSG
jgi:hypothetical protein